MKTLREYAKLEGISYAGAYKRWKDGRIQDAFQDADKQIYVGKREVIESKQNAPVMFDNLPATTTAVSWNEAIGSDPPSRFNKSFYIKPQRRFDHIEESPTPFTYAGTGYKESDVTVRDAIMLCQRAYWGFSIFRSTIELFTEFCVNNIYFKGGSRKSRTFFELFFKKVGINKLQDIFFRELWRSGNCFIYRFFGKLQGIDYKELVKLFGGNLDRTNVEIPIKYILLNPADIHAHGAISFDRPSYYHVLSDYELERIRNPRTPQDQAVFDSLSPEDQKKVKSKGRGAVHRELSVKDIVSVFLSKQSYEAFSVPLGFGVLEHLNHKKELELMDQAIARTIQQVVLLVTTGAPPDQGGINYKNIENLRKIFENESVGRVLISDFTTKAEFVIPSIGDILDPKKYQELNQSIAIGLGNVFLLQGEKFANQSAKIDIFLQRLQGARRLFLEEFIIPEMKLIASELGLKGETPTPYYEELDLKNEVEFNRIYVRLMELGLLTAEEGFKALETGILPSEEDSEASQRHYKELRDNGLYQPLLGKQKQDEGRPSGTNRQQSTKKISPIGAQFNLSRVRDNLIKSQAIEEKIRSMLKKKFSLKKLSDEQESIVQDILVAVIKNESIEQWETCIAEYIEKPDRQTLKGKEVMAICEEYGVDSLMGGILYYSKTE